MEEAVGADGGVEVAVVIRKVIPCLEAAVDQDLYIVV
jgi:hypothetical protein